MLWSIISNILWSISSVFRKKSLEISDLPKLMFRFLWEIAWVVIAIFLIIYYWFDFNQLLDWKLMISIFWIMFVILASDQISQKVYKTEKLTALMPYENLNSVLAIIAWYFMFKDASLISVGIAISVVIITVLSVIDFKEISFPRNMKWVMLEQILITIETLMTWYFLKQISDTDYFILYEVAIISILILPILFKKYYKSLKNLKPVFFRTRFGWSFAWNISFLLYLFLVWEFGIVVSIMLWFLWDGITLIFSFLFLWEKPTKKDIILLATVSILVWIWFYFK